jgi:hypothetical protein
MDLTTLTTFMYCAWTYFILPLLHLDISIPIAYMLGY